MSVETDDVVLPLFAGADDLGEHELQTIAAAARTMDSPEAAAHLARRCLAGEPLGYVLGRQTFMGVEVLVAPGALAPRPETELLGHTFLALAQEAGWGPMRVLDLCCGSGNLACAIAVHAPGCSFWASDLTDGSVALTNRNVAHLGLQHRVRVLQGDLFAPLSQLGMEGTFDAIVANPPYISTGRLAGDRSSLLRYEPREAFDGGPYGLSIHQRIIRGALPFLRVGGRLLLEFGVGQAAQVERLFARARGYGEVVFASDSTGAPRVASAVRQD